MRFFVVWRVHTVRNNAYYLYHVRLSVHPFVRPSDFINWSQTGRVFVKRDIGPFDKNVSRSSTFCQNRTKIWGTLNEETKLLLKLRAG
jgi:hypothetical protein